MEAESEREREREGGGGGEVAHLLIIKGKGEKKGRERTGKKEQ